MLCPRTTLLPAEMTATRTSRRPAIQAANATSTPMTTIQMVIVVSGSREAWTTSFTIVRPLPWCRLLTMALEACFTMTRVSTRATATPMPSSMSVRRR